MTSVLRALAVLPLVVPLGGARTPGPEFQVNTTTAGNQFNPAIAIAPGGDFIVVWHGGTYRIVGQRFRSDGSKLGGQFRVDSIDAWHLRGLDVATDAAGDFVVAWSNRYDNSFPPTWCDHRTNVKAQRFARDGTRLGGEIPVNGSSSLGWDQGLPRVAKQPAGDFVVAWSSYCYPSYGCSDCAVADADVRAQRFAADGTRIGSEFVPHDAPQHDQMLGSVEADGGGRFVVVWRDATDGHTWGQLYASGGSTIGSDIRMSQSPSGWGDPDVGFDGTGGFVAAWLAGHVVARRFASNGAPLGPELPVSTRPNGREPSVAVDPSGAFTVVWTGYTPDANVLGRRFDAAGAPLSGELAVNAYLPDKQAKPRIDDDGAGAFVVTWSSLYQDGDLWGAFGRRFDASTVAAVEKLHIGVGPGPTTAHPPLSAEGAFDGVTGSFGTSVYSDAGGSPVAHYATLAAGVNVGGGDITPAAAGEFLTGPGNVAVFGPHVRGWARGGIPIAKVSFFAYGTLKHGVKVRGAQADGDATHEILTGPGPGALFGPHVRGFDFDGVALATIPRINFYAYDPARFAYGVNLESGDVDADGRDEVATGPGGAAGQGTWLRLWRASAATGVALLAEQDPVYFNPDSFGVTVATGDLDGDARAEVLCGRGPGPVHDGRVKAFRYGGAGALVGLGEINAVAFPSSYGANLAGSDLDADGRAEVYAAPGPDPAAAARLRGFTWSGPGSDLAPMAGFWDVPPFGLAAPAAAHGATLGRGFR